MIELNVIRDTEREQLNKKRKMLSPVFPDKEIFAASLQETKSYFPNLPAVVGFTKI